jgi:hypothetical protein
VFSPLFAPVGVNDLAILRATRYGRIVAFLEVVARQVLQVPHVFPVPSRDEFHCPVVMSHTSILITSVSELNWWAAYSIDNILDRCHWLKAGNFFLKKE